MLEFTTSIRVLDNRGASMKDYGILSLKLYLVDMKMFQSYSSIAQDSYTFSCSLSQMGDKLILHGNRNGLNFAEIIAKNAQTMYKRLPLFVISSIWNWRKYSDRMVLVIICMIPARVTFVSSSVWERAVVVIFLSYNMIPSLKPGKTWKMSKGASNA